MNVNSITGVEILSGTGKTNGSNGKGKDFIKLFNEALGKTSADPGWEDRIEEIPIPGTGYKNLDKNSDNKVNVEDLKIIFPNKANELERINKAMGKKEGDPGWEDTTTWVRRRRRWGWWRRYYWVPQVTPGYKHADFNS